MKESTDYQKEKEKNEWLLKRLEEKKKRLLKHLEETETKINFILTRRTETTIQ